MNQTLELCLDTFGDITDGADGKPLHAAQVIRNLVEEAVLADEVGVDAIGVGEHHRADFAVSAPEIVLAAIASRTKRIRLGSAVTVLSSDDPIRVFQRFSTIDAISNGRAEVILGRGSFTELFPLFGFDLKQYEELFNEKLDLFAAVLEGAAGDVAGRAAAAAAGPERLSENGIRPADDLDRRRRHAAVRHARRALRHADDARDHRRRSEALRAVRGPLSPRAQGDGQAGAAGRRAFARLRRRNRRAGARRAVRRLQAHARQDRRRARLAADEPRRFRARDRARLALCRLARNGRAQDRRHHQDVRSCPLHHEVQRGAVAAREGDALHRALRAEGYAAGQGDGGANAPLSAP